MRRVGIALLVLSFGLPLALAPAADDAKKAEDRPQDKLIGTWKLDSAKYDGQEFQFPEDFTVIKHITPTQWMVVIYGRDGVVTRATGGPYAVKDDVYEETPEYGIGPGLEKLKGMPQKFTWKVEGDRWFHDGTLTIGRTVEEVWKRDRPK